MYLKILKITPVILLVSIITSCSTNTISSGVDNALFPSNIPSNICYLSTTRSANFWFGRESTWHATGTLFDGKYMITAGHNLYDSLWTDLAGIKISCKSSNGQIITENMTRKEIEKTRENSQYNNHGHSFSYDYAFIKLPTAINVDESLKLNKDINLENITDVEVAGYPGGSLLYGQGKFEDINYSYHTFKYDIETAKGMSGGPVWAKVNGSDFLIGVHVAPSKARVVDTTLIDEFYAWKKRMQ